MEATELSLNAVLFGTLYEVVLMFEYVDEILKCDHSRAILSCGLVYYAVKGSSKFFLSLWMKSLSAIQFGAVSYIVRGVSKSALCQAHKISAVKTKLFRNNGLPWLTDVTFYLN